MCGGRGGGGGVIQLEEGGGQVKFYPYKSEDGTGFSHAEGVAEKVFR